MNQLRQERVANGSRRKRDLDAAGVGETRLRVETWIAANLPGESYYAVSTVRYILEKQGRPVTAESVREGLRKRGSLKEQNS